MSLFIIKNSIIQYILSSILLTIIPVTTFAADNNQCPEKTKYKIGETSFGGDSTFFAGCIDKKGELHGFASFQNNKGQKILEGHFNHGIQEGKWTSWYENGKKKSEGYYLDGQFEGKWMEWHDNGTLSAEMNYETGLLQGPVKIWDKEGNLVRIDRYKDGIKIESTPLK